ncbi:hypothetical protein UlMin_036488 [Ulmus minor]
MHRFSQILLCKFLSRYPFKLFQKPNSSIFLKSLPTIPTPNLTNSASVANPRISDAIISNFHHFLYPNRSNSSIHHQNRRGYSGESGEIDQNEEVDIINLKFAEAREEIEMAMDSKETVYFDEEAECARAAVKEVLDLFEGLLAKLPENQKAAVQRAMGLKIEQLKAELQQLDD